MLLLGMSVVAAGSAYTWITTTTQQAQDEAVETLATQVEVKDVRCDRGRVTVSLSNSGDTELSGPVDVFLRGPDGDLHTVRSDIAVDNMSFTTPGGFDEVALIASRPLDRGVRYAVDVEFRGGTTASGTCRPRWTSRRRYVVDSRYASSSLRVAAYDDGTTVTAGSCSTTIDAGGTHTFADTCYGGGDTVTADGRFSANYEVGGADGPIPETFAGERFVYRDCRDQEDYAFHAPVGDADIIVSNSTHTLVDTTIDEGTVYEPTVDFTDGSVYVVESDREILAHYRRGGGDEFFLYPATDELYGLLERVAVAMDDTEVTAYHASGRIDHQGTYDRYDAVATSNNGSQGTAGYAWHLVADKPALGATRCADADNGESDIGIPPWEMAEEFRLPMAVDGIDATARGYYVSVTTADAAECTVEASDGSVKGTFTTAGNTTYPGFFTFNSEEDFNLTQPGARLSCNASAHVQWEPSEYEGESVVLGR